MAHEGSDVPHTIVSGGQTGVDQAAFDVALSLGLAIGGWVPQGRLAEDGIIPARFTGLREADSPDPAVRTRLNVRDSDATVIFSHGPLTGGSRLTYEEAVRIGKPVLHLDLAAQDDSEAARRLREWLDAVRPDVLNVAGPRRSGDPTIGDHAATVLRAALERSGLT